MPIPCHHALAEALRACIDAAGLAEDRKGWLFRTSRGHGSSALSEKLMGQPDAWRMIRRATAAGIAKLYDRTKERLTQDEVERIRLQISSVGL